MKHKLNTPIGEGLLENVYVSELGYVMVKVYYPTEKRWVTYWSLFDKGKEYEVLYIDYDELGNIMSATLNHNLYGSEYIERKFDFIKNNFRTKEELREDKLNELGI